MVRGLEPRRARREHSARQISSPQGPAGSCVVNRKLTCKENHA